MSQDKYTCYMITRDDVAASNQPVFSIESRLLNALDATIDLRAKQIRHPKKLEKACCKIR